LRILRSDSRSRDRVESSGDPGDKMAMASGGCMEMSAARAFSGTTTDSPDRVIRRYTWRADGFMFWLLTGLGFALMVPCVLVPEWTAYERTAVAEQYQRYRAERLRTAVDRERRLLEAVRSDPAVVARLAQRDLGLYRRDERAVLVGVGSVDEETAEGFVPRPVRPPAIVERIARRWPADLTGVFCDNGTRGTIMALSTGLMVVAFALFGRKRG
jgi:hypothetical protein